MASQKDFKVGSWVVYPSHGVGKLNDIEKIIVDGMTLEFFVIAFEKSRLTLKLPVKKAVDAGLRKISSKEGLKEIFDSLLKKSKKRKTMWSKRAQEYEAKINSGNPISIAEVLRELYKEDGENSQSFSERQVYQQAMERLACEVSVVETIDEAEAVKRIETVLRAA